jgi:hypothetical protein
MTLGTDGCGIVARATSNLDSLKDTSINITEGDKTNVTVPNVTITEPIQITNDSLTDTNITGSGLFDVLMRSIKAHLKEEFNANRIHGKEYSQVYLGSAQSAMSQAIQFLLQKDVSYYQAIEIKEKAVQAQKQTAITEALLEQSKLDLDIKYLQAQAANVDLAIKKAQLADINAGYCLKEAQINLVTQQKESELARVSDTRSDGAPVAGSIGKENTIKERQATLYQEQASAYSTDRKVKVAKILSDAYAVNKAQDPDLTPPTNFGNTSIDNALNSIKTDVGL